MAMMKEILRSRNLLLVVLIPLLLLPLPLLYPSSEASCAYVLIVTAVYWVSEAVPLGAAALVPAFLYPLFGVMKSSEVAAEYFKNTTLLLMGVICVAASVEKWNLHKRIALRMVMMAGAKPGMLLLCFMCCTTVLSMWLSNTSTTAMVMPIVEAVLQELVNAEEEHEVISTAGSTITEENEPIGLSEKHGQPSLELIFINEDATTTDFSSLMHSKSMNGVHMIANPIGTMNSKSNGQHLPQAQILVLPPKPSELGLSTKYRYQTRHDHMVCKCLSLSISYAATIGGLTTIIGTSTSLIFLEHFNNHYPNAEVVNFGTWFLFSFPISLIMLVLTWFWMHWLFLGCNFRETCSVSKKKKTKREEMSERRIQEEYKKLGNVSYPEMVTGFFFILMTLLWFTREPGFVPGWSSFFEKKGYRTDATVSVFLGFLLFLIPAKKPCFGKREKGDDEKSTDINTLDPIITWKDFQKTMPWEIVVLVGGGYALAAGCKTSGLSTWIGRQMLSLSSLPYWAVTLLACILVSLVTEFVSNPATITIFLPILCSMSETLLINPLYTLIPVTMCISFAVMLPVGNPPNAIVFSYGHCQIKDMVKAGLGVNLIGLAVVMVAINTWGIRLFQLNSFPEWAVVSNVTSQT
ncbi:solute carrier family 13 member 4 isoform X1 [Haliaeetus albicilla]|uniref:Solute carrier family 13 member 4 n=1 Tax=Haliaeetus albicilla TaxID=8969 RepID=A0A091PC20_HALAL|nr:PREDICTED: solute carrier family 13 member 4 [Haliaeetus albicilla]XP_010564549.1 PREDICTED: solute carrier family 13 member 4 [Haliaeetus leucocephalus]KFQ05130.1 Solute carrier family 13 member 4 [Haliaeetus albicilla]